MTNPLGDTANDFDPDDWRNIYPCRAAHPDDMTCEDCDTVPSGPCAVMFRGCFFCRKVIEPGGVLCDACSELGKEDHREDYRAFWVGRRRYSRKEKKRLKACGAWWPKTLPEWLR